MPDRWHRLRKVCNDCIRQKYCGRIPFNEFVVRVIERENECPDKMSIWDQIL